MRKFLPLSTIFFLSFSSIAVAAPIKRHGARKISRSLGKTTQHKTQHKKKTPRRSSWTDEHLLALREVLPKIQRPDEEPTPDWPQVNWETVAQAVGEPHNSMDCYWMACDLWPVTGTWSDEEIEKLKKIGKKPKKRSFRVHAFHHGLGRGGKQVRERMENHLSEEEKKISPEQESRLLELILEYDRQLEVCDGVVTRMWVENGRQFKVCEDVVKRTWAEFARQIKHNDNRIKNFWNSTLKSKVLAGEVPGYRLTDGIGPNSLLRSEQAPQAEPGDVDLDFGGDEKDEGGQPRSALNTPPDSPTFASPPRPIAHSSAPRPAAPSRAGKSKAKSTGHDTTLWTPDECDKLLDFADHSFPGDPKPWQKLDLPGRSICACKNKLKRLRCQPRRPQERGTAPTPEQNEQIFTPIIPSRAILYQLGITPRRLFVGMPDLRSDSDSYDDPSDQHPSDSDSDSVALAEQLWLDPRDGDLFDNP